MDEDEKKRAADEAKAKEDRDKTSLIGSLFEKIGGFFSNFGSIFMLAAIAIGGYFLATSEKGKELLSGLKDHLPDWAKGLFNKARVLFGAEGALGDMLDDMDATKARTDLASRVSPTILDIIAKDDQTWNEFKGIAKAANGGKLTKQEDLTSPATVMALLNKRPDIVGALFNALKPAPGKTQSDDDKALFTKFLDTAKDLAKGTMLDTLLDNTSRKATLTKILQLKPDLATDADALEKKLIQLKMIDANGKPTQLLRDTLTNALTLDANGNLPDMNLVLSSAVKKSGADKDPALQKEMVDSAIPQLTATVGAANVALLRNTLTDARLIQYQLATTGQSEQQKTMFWLQPENLPAFKKFADAADLSQVPAAMQAQIKQLKEVPAAAIEPMSAIAKSGVNPLDIAKTFKPGDKLPEASSVMVQLLYPANRQLIARAGATPAQGIANASRLMAAYLPANAPAEYKTMLNEHNFQAIYDAATKIGEQRDVPQGHAATRSIVAAIVDYETTDNKTQAFLNYDPAALAKFFHNKDNNDAVRILLSGLEGFTQKKDVVMLNALKAHWGNDVNHGIGEVMGDKDGVEFIQKQLGGHVPTGMVDKSTDWLGANYARIVGMEYALKTKGGVIAENADDLIALHKAIASIPAPTSKPGQSR